VEFLRQNSRVCTVYNIHNDLPLRINSLSEPIHTNVIISSRNFEDFYSLSNLVQSCIIKWFAANNLVLNFDNMNIMKFITKKSSHSTLHIDYKESYIEETMNSEFLGLQIDNHINWKNYIEQMILKK